MTADELQQGWLRWMHNSGVEADLDRVFLMASTRAVQRLMFAVDVPTLLEDETGINVLHHAGLIYLHELARDTEGLQMEQSMFEEAVEVYSNFRSRSDRTTVDSFSYRSAV